MTRALARILMTLAMPTALLLGQATVFVQGSLPPSPPGISAGTIGTPGPGVRCYFVVANYKGGSVVNASTPVCVTNAPSVLGVSNYVQVGWQATTLAVSYDVLVQTQQGSFPLGTGCSACAVVKGTTSTQVADNGGALTSYTFAGYTPSNPRATLYFDQLDYTLPIVKLGNDRYGFDASYFQSQPIDPPGTNGTVRLSNLQVLAGLAASNPGIPTIDISKNAADTLTFGTGIASAYGIGAAVGTVTLTVPQILGSGGGALLTGVPTGPATYTTPTAADICAAVNGQPIQNLGATSNGQFPPVTTPAATNTAVAGTSFEFTIRNASGGGNTITLAAGVGVTLATGGTTVAQNAFRTWRVITTSYPCTTVTMFPLMNGTF